MGKGAKIPIKGLYTNGNPMDVPEGALVVADNVSVRRPGVLEPMRGWDNYGNTKAFDRLAVFRETLVAHCSADDKLYYYNGGTWAGSSAMPTHPDSTTARMRFAFAGKNLYFTTASGVYVWNTLGTDPVPALNIKNLGFDPLLAVNVAAASLVRTGGTTVTGTFLAAEQVPAQYVRTGDVLLMETAGEANFAIGEWTVTSYTATTFVYTEAGANVASGAEQRFRHRVLRNTGGFLADGYRVAYRCLFKRKDANGNWLYSPVSGRHVVANATETHGYGGGVARDVFLRVLLDATIDDDTYLEVYRSRQVTTSIEPSDELQKCYEKKISANDVTRGFFDVLDVTPDASLGEFIYTAANQQGLENNNQPPPFCKDLAFFGNCMFYANTRQPHTVSARYLTSTGLATDDTILAYCYNSSTATYSKNSPLFGSIGAAKQEYPTFYASGGGPMTVPARFTSYAAETENIRMTAQYFAEAWNHTKRFNKGYNPQFYAIHDATDASASGTLRFTKDDFTDQQIELCGMGAAPYGTYSATASSSLSPSLGNSMGMDATPIALTSAASVATGTTLANHGLVVGDYIRCFALVTGTTFTVGLKQILSVPTATTFTYSEPGANGPIDVGYFVGDAFCYSESDAAANRIMWSKPDEYEAVPFLNYADLGDRNSDILRCLPLKDSIFVFKEDGIWRGTGTNGNFSFELFDATIVLVCPDSAVALDNNIMALTNKGVLKINDTGSELVSLAIQDKIDDLQNSSAMYTAAKNYGFGVAYEDERAYELWLPSSSAETKCTQALVYSLTTNAWTRKTSEYGSNINAKHGIYNPTDGRAYYAGANPEGNFALQERKSFTNSDYAMAGIAKTISTVTNGTTVTLNSVTYIRVGDVLSQGGTESLITAINGSVLTLESSGSWSAAACTVLPKIDAHVKLAPVYNGAPDSLKAFSEIEFLFGNCHAKGVEVGCKTDLQSSATTFDADTKTIFGQWTNADTAWDGTERPAKLRVDIPQEQVWGNSISPIINNKTTGYGGLAYWSLHGVVVHSELGTEGEGE